MSRFLLSVFGMSGQRSPTRKTARPKEPLTFIDVFLVVGDQGLGDRLSDGVDLRSVTTTSDANPDIDLGELIETNDKERLVDL